MLSHELVDSHEVQVFARHENSFLPDFHYSTALDSLDPRILLHLINVPLTKYRYKFINKQIDDKFTEILKEFRPDIVHFGHLNHLSLSLPSITNKLNIPSVFTLHDFWLICPRGRFIQRNSNKILELCDKQENKKCALQCYSGYFTGDKDFSDLDLSYWEKWVDTRMKHTKKIVDYVDHFIAPSNFLLEKFIQDFSIPKEKISYLDYGFNLTRLKNRKRVPEPNFVFGYIGTHTPEKGIDLLLQAFSNIDLNAKLKIWGTQRQETKELQAISNTLPYNIKSKIEWMGSYRNENIVNDVFNKIDAIVVPSIWRENSPLVIHEAQQVRIPVITSNYGGMAEYVQDGVNG